MPTTFTKLSSLSLIALFSFEQLFGNVSSSPTDTSQTPSSELLLNLSEGTDTTILDENGIVSQEALLVQAALAQADRSIQADQMDETDPDAEDSSSYFDTDENARDPKSPLPESLYNPNMNYGKGAPAPKPTPMTTKQRNLVFFLASVITASIAMSLASSGSGKSATGTTTH